MRTKKPIQQIPHQRRYCSNTQDKREVHNVYAKAREECERLLDEMIVEVRNKHKQRKSK